MTKRLQYNRWVILTQPGCKPCADALRLLNDHGIYPREFDVTKDMSLKEFLKALKDNPTTPQIFVDGFCIGGRDELVEFIGSITGKD